MSTVSRLVESRVEGPDFIPPRPFQKDDPLLVQAPSPVYSMVKIVPVLNIVDQILLLLSNT